MSVGLDHRINAIFQTYSQVRLAEVENETARVQKLMAHGLALSCLMVKEMQEIEPLKHVVPDMKITKILSLPPQMEKFLMVERKLEVDVQSVEAVRGVV